MAEERCLFEWKRAFQMFFFLLYRFSATAAGGSGGGGGSFRRLPDSCLLHLAKKR